MQMFIDNRLIFKGNSNSGIKRATKTISSIQANIENGKPIAMEGSNQFFFNMNMTRVYMPNFQWESEFRSYKDDKAHIEGPGEQ